VAQKYYAPPPCLVSLSRPKSVEGRPHESEHGRPADQTDDANKPQVPLAPRVSRGIDSEGAAERPTKASHIGWSAGHHPLAPSDHSTGGNYLSQFKCRDEHPGSDKYACGQGNLSGRRDQNPDSD